MLSSATTGRIKITGSSNNNNNNNKCKSPLQSKTKSRASFLLKRNFSKSSSIFTLLVACLLLQFKFVEDSKPALIESSCAFVEKLNTVQPKNLTLKVVANRTSHCCIFSVFLDGVWWHHHITTTIIRK
jgi:hypothetical protein